MRGCCPHGSRWFTTELEAYASLKILKLVYIFTRTDKRERREEVGENIFYGLCSLVKNVLFEMGENICLYLLLLTEAWWMDLGWR